MACRGVAAAALAVPLIAVSCAGSEEPMQVLSGVLAAELQPAAVEIVALGTDGALAARDRGSPLERFVLVVPQNGTYAIEVHLDDGSSIALGEGTYKVCGATAPFDLGTLTRRDVCSSSSSSSGSTSDCELAKSDLASCEGSGDCALLKQKVDDCDASKETGCASQEATLNECLKSCSDGNSACANTGTGGNSSSDAGEQVESAGCASASDALAACDAQYDCERLQSEHKAACDVACGAQSKAVESSCSSASTSACSGAVEVPIGCAALGSGATEG